MCLKKATRATGLHLANAVGNLHSRMDVGVGLDWGELGCLSELSSLMQLGHL